MKNEKVWNVLVAMLLIITSACQKNPIPINEEELITTLTLSVQENGSSTITHFSFEDIDGIGGMPATIDSLLLEKNATYQVSISLFNKSVYPVDTISNEVLEEGDMHQFFYQSIPNTILKDFTYESPNDINGNPIGLNFSFDTDNTSTIGSLKIILRHQPNKNGLNVNIGDITNAVGETDIEIEFPVRLVE